MGVRACVRAEKSLGERLTLIISVIFRVWQTLSGVRAKLTSSNALKSNKKKVAEGAVSLVSREARKHATVGKTVVECKGQR